MNGHDFASFGLHDSRELRTELLRYLHDCWKGGVVDVKIASLAHVASRVNNYAGPRDDPSYGRDATFVSLAFGEGRRA